MLVLGLNAPPLGWHDPSAALVGDDGVVLAFVEEERVSRRKHGLHQYPTNAVAACLEIAGCSGADIDVVCVGWDLPRQWPRTDRDALDPPLPGRLWSYDDWKDYLRHCLGNVRADKADLVFVPHHHAHAASTFHASGFDSAAVLVVDGNGDDEAVSIFQARAGDAFVRRAKFPYTHSLGCMYDAASDWLGLSFLEAGKTMGLAAYGRDATPRSTLFKRSADGFAPPFDLPSDAEYDTIVEHWHRHFDRAGLSKIGTPREGLAEDRAAVELAWTVQHDVERTMSHLAGMSRRLTGETHLCLAGGVALNCSANGQLDGPVYVPPVPHDAGIALGAAWMINPPKRRGVLSPYLGRRLDRVRTDAAVMRSGLREVAFEPDDIADRLLRGEVGAIVAGRAEAGPRALCHRSIISLARNTQSRDRLNALKGREMWRPLSPVARDEDRDRFWPHRAHLSRYMLGAAQVTPLCATSAPGVVHVDGSARPQNVIDREEPVHRILDALDRSGACPVLINTSFNRRGEPIVDDACSVFGAFDAIGLDFLVLDDGRTVARPDKPRGG